VLEAKTQVDETLIRDGKLKQALDSYGLGEYALVLSREGFDLPALAAAHGVMRSGFCTVEAFSAEMIKLGLLPGDLYKLFKLMQVEAGCK
jgi:hypothetical protein